MARTALITGASEGIGYELVKLFAKDGYDCVLAARNKKKMDQLAAEVEKSFGIKTRVIAKDLSLPKSAQEIFDELNAAGVPIDVLINNAGLGLCGDFAKSDMDMNMHLLQVNMLSLTKLTWLFLPGMIKRKYGKIMNVGSIASYAPSPNFALYNASKAYVLFFSEALREELKGTGVTVTCLCPGATDTQWQERAGAKEIRLNKVRIVGPQPVAQAGYKGMMKGKRVVVPGLDNKFTVLSAKLAPRALTLKVARFLTQKTN
jgi:uncharacterized protein